MIHKEGKMIYNGGICEVWSNKAHKNCHCRLCTDKENNIKKGDDRFVAYTPNYANGFVICPRCINKAIDDIAKDKFTTIMDMVESRNCDNFVIKVIASKYEKPYFATMGFTTRIGIERGEKREFWLKDQNSANKAKKIILTCLEKNMEVYINDCIIHNYSDFQEAVNMKVRG